MADRYGSSDVGELQPLHVSPRAKQRTEAIRVAALRAVPPEHEGIGRAPFRIRIPPFRIYWSSPYIRRLLIAVGTALASVVIAIGLLWWRLASGPISLDLVTPWLTAAIEENFGGRYRVEVGGTVLERDENGRTALRIRDIVVRDAEGGVVASAPRAEVGLSGTSLFTGHPRAESLNLVGAELSVRVEPDGDVTVFASADKRPIATAPMLASAAVSAKLHDRTVGSGPMAAKSAVDNIGAVLAWLDSLGAVGLDGHDLTEVGLKSGNLVVEDLRNGQRSRFEKINLSLTRPGAGEVLLSLGSESTERPWTLLAGIKAIGHGRRAVVVEARKVALRDLMLAMRLGDGQIDLDLPMSASLRAEIAEDGTPHLASARMLLGPGTFADTNDPQGRISIDRAELSVEWDAARRAFAAPFQIVSSGNRITLVAQGAAPKEPGAPWTFGLSGGTVLLAPFAPDDEPVLLNRIAVRARLDTVKRRLDIDQAEIGGKNVSGAASGSIDFSMPDPRIAIGIASRNLSIAAFKQLWPPFIKPAVREWALEHFLSGSVERVEIATNAQLSALRRGGPPVPDDGLSIQVVTTNTEVKPDDTLPPIRDADLITRVVGRSVTIGLTRGVVDLPSGRRLTLTSGLFEVPDSQPEKPLSRVRMRIEGPVPAAAEFLSLGRLREASGSPLDPATSRGTVSAQVLLNMPIDPDLPKNAITYNITADLANFAVDRFVMAQRVESQLLRITANQQGYSAKGDVRIGGMPATVEYRKTRDDDAAEVRMQAVFDDAARNRLGFDLSGALTGPIPVRLGGKIPTAADQDNRFAIEADLSQAKIDNLLPGWTKLSGKTARASFTMNSKPGRSTRFEDIVIEGGSNSVKGSVEIDTNGDIVSANFPVFVLSDGDKANLKAERGTDGVLKVTMRGDVYDGRGFVKSMLGGGAVDSKPRRAVADLDLDLKIGAIAGFNGEALRGVDLRLSRRAGQIQAFSLSARHGVDTPLNGDLRGRGGGRQVIYLESNDAGALLRFADTYPRMIGGQMWVAIDPPGMEQTPQEGLLNIRDFVIRGEPGLDRIAAGAPGTQRSGVEFSRMRVAFTRSSGKLTIRDGVVRGMTIGATMDGLIDYAGNDVRLRGTFVPLYGLNNAFGQIPIVGLILGGGSNEGLFGITYEVTGPPGAPLLRVNPISPLAPGLLRKLFEFPSSVPGERFPDMTRQ